MSYKVFFVEDEIITREGIRDNVDWPAHGFEFCGEAADGEMALPSLRAAQPDVLITDIKMPFMDGLQLSKIMRERMPWVKIVILSGHDEFEYAQQAIKLGVTDYLLKPITVQNLQATLQKLKLQLDQERHEHEDLARLQKQIDENLATLRERLLFKLIVGAIPPIEIMETGRMLGLDLTARHYLVALLKIELDDLAEPYNYEEYQQLQNVIVATLEKNPDIFTLKRDWGDLILIMKNETPEYLEEEQDILLENIKQLVAKTRYKLVVGTGSIVNRPSEISRSFIEALSYIQTVTGDNKSKLNLALAQVELLRMDKSAIENYLRSGVRDGFDQFFDEYIKPLGDAALKSTLIKNYILVNVVLAVAKLVNDLGGNVDKTLPELDSLEALMTNIRTIEQLREQVCKLTATALEYRDSQPKGQYKSLIRQVREYIERHYAEPELSLNTVAAQANLSPSHFSVVFGQEMGCTFKEYLIDIRITKAKELLRMTGLRSADIAYQVGYNDPHYFSSVFKKHTGFSPLEFRSQI